MNRKTLLITALLFIPLLALTMAQNSSDGRVDRDHQSSQDLTESPPSSYFYRVKDVNPGDVLNVRAEPNAQSSVIGSFAYNKPLIEINGRDGKWLRVNLGEQSGWVNARFLAPLSVARLANTNLPDGLSCYGEEPFWLLRLTDQEVSFEPFGEDKEAYRLKSTQTVGGKTYLKTVSSKSTNLDIEITEASCKSTMTDTYFNWSAQLTGVKGGTQTGCCRLIE